jgi:hypothetical protein
VSIGPSAGQRSQQQRRDAKRAHRNTDARLTRAERPGDEERRHADQGPGAHEVGKIGQGQRHERGGEEATVRSAHG